MEQKNKIPLKKGIQLNQAFGAVLTIVLVAVLVIIAIVVFVSLQSSFAGSASASISDEVVVPTDAGTAVAASTACEFGGFAVSTVYNGTAGPVINTANYTVGATGTITNLTSEFSYASDDWNVNYTYTWGSEACNASEDMVTEFGNYTSLIGLVGTIIFLGLVIGVLVASFAFGGRENV